MEKHKVKVYLKYGLTFIKYAGIIAGIVGVAFAIPSYNQSNQNKNDLTYS